MQQHGSLKSMFRVMSQIEKFTDLYIKPIESGSVIGICMGETYWLQERTFGGKRNVLCGYCGEGYVTMPICSNSSNCSPKMGDFY